MPSKILHLAHPTDTRRTIGGYWRTACGRWGGIAAFFRAPSRVLCPKCAVLALIAESSTPLTEATDVAHA